MLGTRVTPAGMGRAGPVALRFLLTGSPNSGSPPNLATDFRPATGLPATALLPIFSESAGNRGVWALSLRASEDRSSRSAKPKCPHLAALGRDTCPIGEAGFEPATARPPAGGQVCQMRPYASLASPLSIDLDSSDVSDDASGTKSDTTPRSRMQIGRPIRSRYHLRIVERATLAA